MNLSYFHNIKQSTWIKIFLFLILLLTLPTATSYTFIKKTSFDEIEKSLTLTVSKIKKDLIYDNGKWNMDFYYSDPDILSPNSTNIFSLYIITTNGFILERSRPISGLLDTADFKNLLKFQSPQNITSVTNETWRIMSKSIIRNGDTVGLITASYYSPQDNIELIDLKLKNSLSRIYSKIKINGLQPEVKPGDLKAIPYDVSYMIVNNLNKVILTKGRIPALIDVSYVAAELSAGKRIVADKKTQEKYLVLSQPLTDNKGLPVGVVVAARPVSTLFSLLNNFLLFSFVSRFIFTIPLTLLAIYILRKDIVELLKDERNKRSFKQISFDRKKSIIEIDTLKIQIPYASNQYYLCKALFSEPQKFWEVDELLEAFGQEEFSGKARPVYDAMLAVNKKLGIRLIKYQGRTYTFNPDFISKLS